MEGDAEAMCNLVEREISTPGSRILVVDDEQMALDSVSLALRSAGIGGVLTCNDARCVEQVVDRERVELVLLDLVMPYLTGGELIDRLKVEHPDLLIIVVTGSNDVSLAVDCMRQGVLDYLVKPVEPAKLIGSVKRALDMLDLRRENRSLTRHLVQGSLEDPESIRDFVVRDRKMISLLLYVEAISRDSQTVLVTGETGVGKELVAQAIHRMSKRPGEFVAVNMAGLDDAMVNDTLFGHVKGSYTGASSARSGLIERAAEGTLFLDEVVDLGVPSQVKLLRLLESLEYYPIGCDVPRHCTARVVVATNRDPRLEAMEGRFRKDLYYRLRTHQVDIPPLRERLNDIAPLAEHFVQLASREFGKEPPPISPDVLRLLESYSFPGNVRELRALIYDAVGRHQRGPLTESLFPVRRASEGGDAVLESVFAGVSTLPALHEVTEDLVREAMRRSGGNQTLAAKMLGVTPQAISRRMRRRPTVAA